MPAYADPSACGHCGAPLRGARTDQPEGTDGSGGPGASRLPRPCWAAPDGVDLRDAQAGHSDTFRLRVPWQEGTIVVLGLVMGPVLAATAAGRLADVARERGLAAAIAVILPLAGLYGLHSLFTVYLVLLTRRGLVQIGDGGMAVTGWRRRTRDVAWSEIEEVSVSGLVRGMVCMQVQRRTNLMLRWVGDAQALAAAVVRAAGLDRRLDRGLFVSYSRRRRTPGDEPAQG